MLERDAPRTAVGGPHTGLAGFCRAHGEARRVEELRDVLVTDRNSLSFDGLALDALLLHDVPAAAAYALDELGELAADTPRAEKIRETLHAFLASGSQTSTASLLGVHENTVRLRLQAVAETLGPHYAERRTELLVALRLCRRLGAARLASHRHADAPSGPAHRGQGERAPVTGDRAAPGTCRSCHPAR